MKRLMLMLLCCAALLCGGCAGGEGEQQSQERTYELYFRVTDLEAAAGKDAIGVQSSDIPLSTEVDAVVLAEKLMSALLAGPDDVSLRDPFPPKTELRSVRISGGRAYVDMSTVYETLSGVELAMADYCITLTLTQIPEIRSVSITVNDQPLAHRSSQTFSARDVLISSGEDVVATVEVVLYFCNESGALSPETRVLELYEGDTRAENLVAALMQGPENKALLPSIPEGFYVQSVWAKDGICYVNLSVAMRENLPEETDMGVLLQALTLSLLSLENVEGVRLLMDGTADSGITASQELPLAGA